MIDKVDLTPSPQYLDVIRRGAEQNRIPEKYRQWLGTIKDNGYSGNLKIMDDIAPSVEEDTFLYYSFGSNMLKGRILINNPSAEFIGPAKLQGYKLLFRPYPGFKQKTCMWKGAPATVEEDPNSHVWGAIWRLGKSDLEHLDRQESCYHALEVTVKTQDGEEQVCRTYQMTERLPEQRPSPHYLKVMIEGARLCGVPSSYVDMLQKVTHNEDSCPKTKAFVDKLVNESS